MKQIILFIYIIILLLSACTSKPSEKLSIATAANMQFAMEALTTAFSAETGILCETIISSSGKITAQVKAGAPYSVFVSADMKYPMALYKEGLTVEQPLAYAKGTIVLWTMHSDINPSLDDLTKPNVKHIAMANPKIAPYGAAAMEALQQKGLAESLATKFVFGESIAQTNQFILSQAADIGFTAKSVVLSPRINQKGQWTEIDTSLYTPIIQGIALLKNVPESIDQAQQFKEFLISPKGKEILSTFGYLE